MTIKRLLLASTALLAAAGGARAADTVVMAEPEPVDYVRVCDVYGTGYFYIPGTETCLKIGGYVRMRLNAGNQEYNRDPDGSEDYSFASRVRVRLEFDTREDTELGTLRAKARVQSTNSASSTGGYTMDEGFIQLGGLTMGYLDSAWTYNDGGMEDGLLVDDDSDFAAGDFNQNRISYIYTRNGFSGLVSLEDDADGDFRPDVIGKLAYKGKWGGAYLMGVYDEDSADALNRRRGIDPLGNDTVYTFGDTEFDGNGDEGAVVLKGAVLLTGLLVEGSTFKVEGHYAFDPSRYAVVGDLGQSSIFGSNDFNQTSATSINGGNLALSSEWQVGAAYKQTLGKLFGTLAGLYGETFDVNATSPGFDYGNVGAIDYWGTVGEVGYNVTNNFSVTGQLSYVDLDLPAAIDDFDQTRGFLEFRRTF